MATILDDILRYFGIQEQRLAEEEVQGAVQVINTIYSRPLLESFKSGLKRGLETNPAIMIAFQAAEKRCDESGDLGMFGALPKALMDGFGQLGEEMDRRIAEMIRYAMKPGSPDSLHALEEVIDTILGAMLDASSGGGLKLDMKTREQITGTLRPMIVTGLMLTVATALAELIHPTKEMGWGQVSHFLYETVGFNRMAEAYTDPLREAMIKIPFKHQINALTQNYLPSPGEIAGLARKYEIPEETYRETMRAHGIQERFIEAMYAGFWADPRLFEILRLMEVETPPPNPPAEAAAWLRKAGLEQYIGPNWWLAMKFAKAGYDRIDIPVLIRVVNARFIQKELGDLRNLQRSRYKSGRLTREEYERYLTSKNVPLEEAKTLIDSIEEERSFEVNKELERAYEYQFRKGRIDADELKAQLRRLKRSDPYIDARLLYLEEMRTKKLGTDEDTRALTKTDITNAYKQGRISKADAIKRLDADGFTVEDATLIVEDIDHDLQVSINNEWIRAFEQAAKKGRITIDELAALYVEHGKSPEWAEARAAYIQQLAKEPEEATIE